MLGTFLCVTHELVNLIPAMTCDHNLRCKMRMPCVTPEPMPLIVILLCLFKFGGPIRDISDERSGAEKKTVGVTLL